MTRVKTLEAAREGKGPPFINLVLVLVCLLSVGCSSLITDYGYSKGRSGRASLNGFAGLRNVYEQDGFQSRDVTRLTNRVKQADVIVWTPRVFNSVDYRVTKWFENWLSSGNKTLVYIVPDSGSETDYWLTAGQLAPPGQRLEYRKRAAESINERMAWRTNRSRVASNGWFQVEPQISRLPIDHFRGPWQEQVSIDPESSTPISMELLLKPYDADEEKAALAKANGTAQTGTGTQAGPNAMGWAAGSTTTPTTTEMNFQPLLKTQKDDAIVAEVRAKSWNNSRIIVVAGGSLLTNFALSRSVNRDIAQEIVSLSKPDRDTPPPMAGFLTSDWAPVSISEKQPGAPVATGMELLTVWPLSLVTLHAAVLGLVVCLMLLPIFGRPRKITRVEQSNFGDHLDAVAALMNRAGGRQYAEFRISEYFKRVRGETAGPWVLPDQPPSDQPKVKPLPSLSTRRPDVG